VTQSNEPSEDDDERGIIMPFFTEADRLQAETRAFYRWIILGLLACAAFVLIIWVSAYYLITSANDSSDSDVRMTRTEYPVQC